MNQTSITDRVAIFQQFSKTLRNLQRILEKAKLDAETRKFDVNNFCSSRLFPDMLPFAKQIQIACDVAKISAATLSQKEAPKHDDKETTIDQLIDRIALCLSFLESIPDAAYDTLDAKALVSVPYPQGKTMHAQDALISRSIPNFYFHVSMAYALLRAGGVPLGKGDFLGELRYF